MNAQRSVLVLGARSPVALELSRRFKHAGWHVIVADSIPHRMTAWSGAVDRSIRLPAPRVSLSAYAKALSSAITQHGIALVVPTCEEVFHLSAVRPSLPSSTRVCVADLQTLRRLHSKWDVLGLANPDGANGPDSELVESEEQARAWARDAPVVLKPEFSRFGSETRVFDQGLPMQPLGIAWSKRWLVQEFCRGDEVCSYSIASEGRLLAHATYQPLRRLARSASYCFQSVDAEPVLQCVRRLVATLNFTGQIGFDWIRQADGQYRLIECNPRAVSGVHLFERGACLPDALVGTAGECIQPLAGVSCMLAPVMLGAGLPQALAEGDYMRWKREWISASDVISAPADRRPLAGSLIDLFSYAGVAVRNGCTFREASTLDIFWNGEPLHAGCA